MSLFEDTNPQARKDILDRIEKQAKSLGENDDRV